MQGDLSNPQSLNLYAYCENNPVNAVDPDGEITVKFNFGFNGWLKLEAQWGWVRVSFNIAPGMLANLGISFAVGGAVSFAVQKFIRQTIYYYGSKYVFIGATWLTSKLIGKLSGIAAKKSFGVFTKSYNWLSKSIWVYSYTWRYL